MGTPEFPPRFYTKGLEPKLDKSIGYYSGYTKVMTPMMAPGVFFPDELEEIKMLSLGLFVRLHEMQFHWASRLVHHKLTLQLQYEKEHEIWSLIGVNPIRFSLHEFEHITCLNCENVENLGQPHVEITEDMDAFWNLLGLSVDQPPSLE